MCSLVSYHAPCLTLSPNLCPIHLSLMFISPVSTTITSQNAHHYHITPRNPVTSQLFAVCLLAPPSRASVNLLVSGCWLPGPCPSSLAPRITSSPPALTPQPVAHNTHHPTWYPLPPHPHLAWRPETSMPSPTAWTGEGWGKSQQNGLLTMNAISFPPPAS